MHQKLTIVILLLTFNFTVVFAQTYTMKTPISENEKKELLRLEKDLFEIHPNFSFQFSNYDALKSFSDLKDQDKRDEKYLKKIKDSLLADSLNPVFLNDIGDYYRFYENQDSAQYFFKKSLQNLSVKYFNNDSAVYLSFKGALKVNLGLDDAITDIEHALELNPDDSIAINLYPTILFSKQGFKKVKEFVTRKLETDTEEIVYYFVLLATSQILDDWSKKSGEASVNKKLNSQYANTDYNKLVDFNVIDKFANKYKKNIEIKNARYMADLSALVFKMTFFETTDNLNTAFPFSRVDKNRLISLEKTFTSPEMKNQLNLYSLNKSLGLIYLMLQKKDKAISAFNEAIKAFPERKKMEMFNSAEMYDALLSTYFIYKDSIGFIQTLQIKIKAEPLGKKDVNDYLLMAKQYFLKDEIQTSEEWANKAKQVNARNFDVLRLLAHLNFIKMNYTNAQSYAEDALKNMQSNSEQYQILLQFAIYYLINGDATTAYNNIEAARKSLEAEPCTLCDKLIEKYISINLK